MQKKKRINNPEVCGNSFCVKESSITLSQRFRFTVHFVFVSLGIKSLGGSCTDNGSEKNLRLLKQLYLETPYNEYCIFGDQMSFSGRDMNERSNSFESTCRLAEASLL